MKLGSNSNSYLSSHVVTTMNTTAIGRRLELFSLNHEILFY
jgi:hypothetical protein